MVENRHQVLEKFRPRVLYFCSKYLRDYDAAQDITQQTMLVVLRALHEDRIVSQEKVGSYAFRVAENLIKKRFRDRNRPGEQTAIESVESATPWLESPEARLLAAEEKSQIDTALNKLSRNDRELLCECFYSEHSLEEIAVAMGITYSALRKRKSRALGRLRRTYRAVTKRDLSTHSSKEQKVRMVNNSGKTNVAQ